MISDAELLVAFELQLVERLLAAQQGHAAAGDDAFFEAAWVACLASSSSALRSFISVSVAAPTLI
jgi:hypothetical protein